MSDWTITGQPPTGGAADTVNPQRDMTKYLAWIKDEFAPLTLATPINTIAQQFENAIRYWNTYSGFKITTMVDYNTKGIKINPQIKSVIDVVPAMKASHIWNDHPLWTLLGVTIIDNVTGDLIMMSEAFRSYRMYVGTNFNWSFYPSENPEEDGTLLVVNAPRNASKLAVIGLKRIVEGEDVKNEYILNWLLYYAKSLVKQIEGNTLRKADVVNVKTDGDTLVQEGIAEMKELQEQLHRDKMWVALAKRG